MKHPVPVRAPEACQAFQQSIHFPLANTRRQPGDGWPGGTVARTAAAVLLIVFLAVISIRAQEIVPGENGPENGRTLSPFFWIPDGNPDVDGLPLESTGAEVHISGVIADVKVSQVYRNRGKRALEAIYIFPASTRAAVYAMKMTIGERVVEARIMKREEARQTYEQARQEGKSASLLEQHRPNVFQMSVANIMPGDRIQVEMRYTELLVPESGVYTFVYPAVAGPRYSNQPADGATDSQRWVENPYLHKGSEPVYQFGLQVALSAGLPIAKIGCPSHQTKIQYDGPENASVSLAEKESGGGNRDFILEYRLAGGRIQSGLLLSQGEKENFFLLMVQPPARVAEAGVPPREYVFIVDVSGSMHGFPLDLSKKLLRDLIGGLRPSDRFNVLLFAGGSELMAHQSLAANQENIGRAIQFIGRQQGGGGTELLPALRRALALPATGQGVSRSFIVLTDGYVDVEREAFELVRQHLGEANVFAFGIGSSVNRFLIEGLARAGLGEPFVVEKPERAEVALERFRRYVQHPLLTGIRIGYEDFTVYDVEPASCGDLLAERPLLVFGKWRGPARGIIRVEGRTGGRLPFQEAIQVEQTVPASRQPALRYLWARHRIATLADLNQAESDAKTVEEITRLGLSYNLLTGFTSFVAVDSRVRNENGQTTTVQQPLPLPEGVSDLAVGGGSKGKFQMSGTNSKSFAFRTRQDVATQPPAATVPATAPLEAEETIDHGLAGEEKKTEAAKLAKSPAAVPARLAAILMSWKLPVSPAGTILTLTLAWDGAKLSLVKMEVLAGIRSAVDLQSSLRSQLAGLSKQFKETSPGLTPGRWVLDLQIDPDGSVHLVPKNNPGTGM